MKQKFPKRKFQISKKKLNFLEIRKVSNLQYKFVDIKLKLSKIK